MILTTYSNGSQAVPVRFFDSGRVEVEIVKAKGHHHVGDHLVWPEERANSLKKKMSLVARGALDQIDEGEEPRDVIVRALVAQGCRGPAADQFAVAFLKS